MINKMYKPLTRLTKKERDYPNKKWKRRQSNDAAEIQKTTRKYYEQLYVKKFSDLEEMDKYLETYSPSKWINNR